MVDFFFSLVCSPAAVAAIVLAMYYVFPSPLVQGYLRYWPLTLCRVVFVRRRLTSHCWRSLDEAYKVTQMHCEAACAFHCTAS